MAPQFIEPPIFREVPRGPSLGANLARGIQNMMASLDAHEEKRKEREREAIAAAMEGENRLLELAPLLSEFEAAPPTRLTEPAQPELGIPERPGPTVQLGTERIAKPLLTELTLPSGRKVPIPAVRGSRERLETAERVKAEEGTELVTPELHAQLPDFYKSRWKPGQRVSTKDIGAVGMQILEAARQRVTTPNYKAVFDTQTGKDTMASDEMITQDPARYGPPREARLTASEERASRATEAGAARAEAARAKEEERQREIEDAADRIANGEPAANVAVRVRDAAVRLARGQGARVYTTQPQKDKVTVLDSIKGDVDRLTELLSDPNVAQYFGPVVGRAEGIMERAPEGIPIFSRRIPPEVLEARSLMLNLQDRSLRQRSGAQINVQEMRRITQFTPDPAHRMSKTVINLARMGAELEGLINAQVGGPAKSKSAAIKPGTKIGRFTVVSVSE